MDYGLWFTIIQIQINLLDYANFETFWIWN